jgi:hypothetical protein
VKLFVCQTLLGHFCYEVGHYFWDVLVRDRGKLEACRAMFGDDSMDYSAAPQRHYAEGPPRDWQQRFVSAYATTYPWEDFAETWASSMAWCRTLPGEAKGKRGGLTRSEQKENIAAGRGPRCHPVKDHARSFASPS